MKQVTIEAEAQKTVRSPAFGTYQISIIKTDGCMDPYMVVSLDNLGAMHSLQLADNEEEAREIYDSIS